MTPVVGGVLCVAGIWVIIGAVLWGRHRDRQVQEISRSVVEYRGDTEEIRPVPVALPERPPVAVEIVQAWGAEDPQRDPWELAIIETPLFAMMFEAQVDTPEFLALMAEMRKRKKMPLTADDLWERVETGTGRHRQLVAA